MRIERVTEPSTELVDAFARLIPQLSRRAAPPTLAALADLISSERTHLLVARDEAGAIVGSLTLAIFRIPTGLGAWIEDVVVDESARGQGVGEALTRAAMEAAAAAGVEAVALTSRPDREAANRLYRRVGFQQRETNVYVWRPR